MNAYEKGYNDAKKCQATDILEDVGDLVGIERGRMVEFYKNYHFGWNAYVNRRKKHKKH